MSKIFSALLPIALAGFCLQAQNAEASQTVPKSLSAQYTSVAAQTPVKGEIIPVRIDIHFTSDERAKIVEAVRQWNHALNGQIRFDIQAQAYDPNSPSAAPTRNTWTVARVSGTGASPIPGRGPGLGTLAMTQELTHGSGMVVVFADKIGNRDLSKIMMHEIGHVLGLGHEHAGRLMAPYYSGDAQQCIDKGAMQALAHSRGLPFQALNWCGDAGQVAAANRQQVAAR